MRIFKHKELIYGISLEINGLDVSEIYYLELKIVGGSFSIVDSKYLHNLGEFISLISQNPFIVNINGKSVINKFYIAKGETAAMDLLKNLLPGVNSNEYLVESLFYDQGQILSILKKQTLQDILGLFSDKKCQLCGIYFGLFPINFYNYFSTNQSEIGYSINLKSHIVNFRDGLIVDLKSDELLMYSPDAIDKNYQIKVVELPIVLSMLSFRFKVNLGVENAIIVNNRNNYNRISNSLKVFKMGVFFCFIIILLSLIFRKHLDDKIHDLIEKDKNELSNIIFIDSLKMELEKYQNFSNLQSTNQDVRFTKYALDLTMDLPINLVFNSLELFPREKAVTDSLDFFKDQVILINGLSDDNEILNKWVDKVEKLGWIQKLEVVNLNLNKNNLYNFDLQITIK